MNAKKLLLAAALLGGVSTCATVGAETYDVFDRENNKALLEQSKKMDQTLKALKGNKDMGKLEPGIARHVLPDDFDQQFKLMRKSLFAAELAGNAQMKAAKEIFSEVNIFGCAERLKDKKQYKKEMTAACQAIELAAPLALATLNEATAKAKKRMENIQSMMTAIDQEEGDLKRSADLSARIQAEMAMLQNEKMLIDMAMQTHAQQLAVSRDYYMQWKAREVKEQLVDKKDGVSIFGND